MPDRWTDAVDPDDNVIWTEDVAYSFGVDPSIAGVDLDDHGCGNGWLARTALLAVGVALVWWWRR